MAADKTPATASKYTTWEYHWTVDPTAAYMTKMGAAGWEVVSVNHSEGFVYYYMKRPIV